MGLNTIEQKICYCLIENECNYNKNTCKKCALAYPEKFSIIQANHQDISGLKMK